MPMILRPLGDKGEYQFVGEAYVYGIIIHGDRMYSQTLYWKMPELISLREIGPKNSADMQIFFWNAEWIDVVKHFAERDLEWPSVLWSAFADVVRVLNGQGELAKFFDLGEIAM